ncbi:MAG: hypothetical protein H6976_11220 [Gammaproteobacteria bacterium]|nr:hypothetical protein [Gammaproteobacteria bacterium]
MPCLIDLGLAVWAPLHPAIVGNKGLSAPARDNPILRCLLGVSDAAPGIDKGARCVELPSVADDERFPLVVDVATDAWRRCDRPLGSRDAS